MERLQHAGTMIIPITGRPAGWGDHIARMWPVEGLVDENGAFYFYYNKESQKMTRRKEVRSLELRVIDLLGTIRYI